jgi:hypothetical protein
MSAGYIPENGEYPKPGMGCCGLASVPRHISLTDSACGACQSDPCICSDQKESPRDQQREPDRRD